MQDRKFTDEQLHDIAETNVNAAIDQRHEYTSPDWGSGDAYLQNTMDTVREEGGTVNDIWEAHDLFFYIANGRLYGDFAYDGE